MGFFSLYAEEKIILKPKKQQIKKKLKKKKSFKVEQCPLGRTRTSLW